MRRALVVAAALVVGIVLGLYGRASFLEDLPRPDPTVNDIYITESQAQAIAAARAWVAADPSYSKRPVEYNVHDRFGRMSVTVWPQPATPDDFTTLVIDKDGNATKRQY